MFTAFLEASRNEMSQSEYNKIKARLKELSYNDAITEPTIISEPPAADYPTPDTPCREDLPGLPNREVKGIIEISSLDNEALTPYAALTERNLRQSDLLIAESPKVIQSALDSGLKPVSLLCERKHIAGDAAEIISRFPDMPVFTGERELLSSLTGYTLTRGVLCAMERPAEQSPDKILHSASRICVIYDVCDTTNIGAIFRTAAALGFDGVLLSPESCDPFNRRSIRVSMGAVFKIKWCFDSNILESLKRHGFQSVGMALRSESVFLQDFNVRTDGKYAVILGSEGYGLPQSVIDSADIVVKIPMHHDIDSLNVGAAAAITLWHFRAF